MADQVLAGTDYRDLLVGGAGNDTLLGGLDSDVLLGGPGNDLLIGDPFKQTVPSPNPNALRLNDYLVGGAGNDVIYGDGAPQSVIWGNDTLRGGAGDDSLYGGGGNDVLYGGNGHNLMEGDLGADQFHPGHARGTVDTIPDFNFADGDRLVLDHGQRVVSITYSIFNAGADVHLSGGVEVIVQVYGSALPADGSWIVGA